MSAAQHAPVELGWAPALLPCISQQHQLMHGIPYQNEKASSAWVWHERKSGNFEKNWSGFWNKILLWPCCSPAWFCQAWTNHPALNINRCQCKIAVCVRHCAREKERKKERNLEVAVIIQLIHCFVVKVIEVTVLRDLCGTYFFQVHIGKEKN